MSVRHEIPDGPPSTSTRGAVEPALHRAGWLDLVWVVAGSLLLGGLTSYAQGVLPEWMQSLANSPSGWTALTVVLIAWRNPGLWSAAGLGAASFVCLVLGYTWVSELRGLTYSPVLWGGIGLVAGPAIGWATSAALGARPTLSVVGSSLLAAVAINDAVYGLTAVSESTSPIYWSIAGLAGVALLVLVGCCRQLRWRWVVGLVALTAAWVAAGSAAYAVLSQS